jgi:predicted DNA-binding transcriptional regulator AlpA
VHPGTVDRYVRLGILPRPVKLGGPRGECRWLEHVIKAWENVQFANGVATEGAKRAAA